MGYYTRYNLETDAEDDQSIVDALREKEVIGGRTFGRIRSLRVRQVVRARR